MCIVCPSVLSLSNLKLRKTQAVKNIFIQEKFTLLTFDPGLALTGFRTTRHRTSCFSSKTKGGSPQKELCLLELSCGIVLHSF